MRIRRPTKSLTVAAFIMMLGAAFSTTLIIRGTAPAADSRADSGTFVLKLAGHEYGTEKFSLDVSSKQVTVKSESQLKDVSSGQMIRTTSRLVLDDSLNPQTYTWFDKGPEKFDLSVNFATSPAKSTLHRPTGKNDVREFQLPRNVLVLDNNVIVHYQVLLDRFAAAGGGKQIFQAFIPQSALPGSLTIQDAGTQTTTLGGIERQLRHVVVLSDNAQIDLWMDDANRLQRLYWSAPQIEAVRQP